MGAWGVGPFDNDEALELLNDVVAVTDDIRAGRLRTQFPDATPFDVLDTVLQDALADAQRFAIDPEPGRADAAGPRAASEGLAAAELVAAAYGRPGPRTPPVVLAWVSSLGHALPDGLITLARDTARAIGQASLLAELWAESGQLEEWRVEVTGVVRRLS
jgi:hypothetical protein